jgi:hypothetical protein
VTSSERRLLASEFRRRISERFMISVPVLASKVIVAVVLVVPLDC